MLKMRLLYLENVVKVDIIDVQPEVDFWISFLIYYVIGENPPPFVMEGFIRGYGGINVLIRLSCLKRGLHCLFAFNEET